MEDLWKSTGEVIRERLMSPVVGPFVTAWAAWNYKFLVILFSNNTVTKTFELIEQLYPNWWVRLGKGFFIPLCTAAAYVVLLPYAERLVLEVSLHVQKRVLALKRQHANLDLLTQRESDAVKSEINALKEAHRIENERKDDVVEKQNRRLEVLQQKVSAKPPARLRMPDDITPEELELLSLISALKHPAQTRL